MGGTEISNTSEAAAKAGAHMAQVLEQQEEPMAYILRRARSEVHLLLDNLSANPDTTISALTAAGRPAELDENWLEEDCRVTWPPDIPGAIPTTLAEQAALLIRAKDYLNSLAKPGVGFVQFPILQGAHRLPDRRDEGLPGAEGPAPRI
ncbi:MAG TPA: hypothetical protein VF535_01320 [Allosphingosinicella sp.]